MNLTLTLRAQGGGRPEVREFKNVIHYGTRSNGDLEIITNPKVYLFQATQWSELEVIALGTAQGAAAS